MDNKLMKLLEGRGDNYILPFFWQHGEDEATLREYMKVIDEANIGAVCVESRPHPDYVGPKWWADMDVILDEARKRNMKVWILDDSHFPTGFANGAMATKPLTLARRSVCAQKYQVEGPCTFALTAAEVQHPAEFQPSQLEMMMAQMSGKPAGGVPQAEFTDDACITLAAVSAAGEKVDLKPLAGEDGLTWQVPAGKWTIYKTNTTRNRGPHQTYMNMLDAESVRVLIDTVYEPHWDHYKEDFGKTIAGFFSDEPELGNGHLYDKDSYLGQGFAMDYPWSRELDAALAEAFGEDLPYELPLIWETEGDENARAQARYTYMDCLSRLVEKDFSFQLGDWCRAHGVAYIGHEIEDNGQHARTGSSLGHYFRGLAGESWAGIDDIGGQVYPFGEDDNFDRGPFEVRNGNFYHYMLGKLANSHAAIDTLKKGNAMCELFGAYGWQEGVQLEKYLADHLMVRGINHFVPHAFSPAPFPDPDCPPHFYAHGHNPQYRHFGSLMSYMNRVCELITDGRHLSPVAIAYHGEGEWTGKCMADEIPARALYEAQIDYDFLPQDVFLERDRFRTVIADGTLKVNTQEYKAFVIPYMQFVTAELAAAVQEAVKAGLPVFFLGDYPEGICNKAKGLNGQPVSAEEEAVLITAMKECPLLPVEDLVAEMRKLALEDISLSAPDMYVHYYHYVHADGTVVYMIINEGHVNWKGQITFKQMDLTALQTVKRLYVYDAWNNALYPASVTDGKLDADITPRKSLLLIALPEGADTAAVAAKLTVPVAAEGAAVALAGSWKRSTCTSIDYPAFGETKEVSLPDTLAAEEPDFSGFVRYENAFEAEEGASYVLQLTEAFEGVEVFLNGVSLGIQIVAPYVFDLTPAVKAGENRLAIEVATTLERETYKIPEHFGRPKPAPTCGSGITGSVTVFRR